jgi:hypothetical protein
VLPTHAAPAQARRLRLLRRLDLVLTRPGRPHGRRRRRPRACRRCRAGPVDTSHRNNGRLAGLGTINRWHRIRRLAALQPPCCCSPLPRTDDGDPRRSGETTLLRSHSSHSSRMKQRHAHSFSPVSVSQ